MLPNNIPVEYDESTHTYWVEYDRECEESVTTAIVMGIAKITDTSITEIEPLFETINTDGLNALYAPTSGDSSREEGIYTTFIIQNYNVTVYADGEIALDPLDIAEKAT